MKISIAQISSKLSKDNIKKHISYIKKAIDVDSDIVIFPELSLNGYSLMDLVYEDAFIVDELDEFIKYSSDIDILLGLALREKHKIFNSSIYFCDGEIKYIYHKNTLPNYGMFQEARFFFAGDILESFETKYGSVITVICEDLWNSKIIDKIVSLKPDFVYVLSASPARGFDSDKLEIEQIWDSILSTTANLSGAYIIFANRVGFEDGLGFWGGSKVIDPKGKIIKKADLFEEMLLDAQIDKKLSNTQKYFLRLNN